MMIKHVLFLLLLTGALQHLQAQRSIEVRLYDAAMTPIAGVPVSIAGMDMQTTTDAMGQFALLDLPTQANTLEFHFPGRPSLTILIPDRSRFFVQLTQDFSLQLLENK